MILLRSGRLRLHSTLGCLVELSHLLLLLEVGCRLGSHHGDLLLGGLVGGLGLGDMLLQLLLDALVQGSLA